MSSAEKTPQPLFKVGDVVRVKAKADIPTSYHFAVGHIVEVYTEYHWPYLVTLQGKWRLFTEDELEKI